ncbi:MAG: hypothetical protein ACLQHF_13425 [Terracidiphilus sp.]
MCYVRHSMPFKARIFLVIGMFCLAASPALGVFAHDLNSNRLIWLDFVRGLLLGLAIAFNLGSARIAHRCAPADLLTR